MNLKKSTLDIKKEERDLEALQVLRFLSHQDSFKFNVGDILIKKTVNWDENKPIFETDLDEVGAPIKYVYAFENNLGVGYIKALKKDGQGPSKSAVCLAKFDPRNTRFALDPHYADHLILGEGEYKYNAQHEYMKTYRNEAMEKNKTLLINAMSDKDTLAWWRAIKVGDLIYCGAHYTDDYDPVNDVETFSVEDINTEVWEAMAISKNHGKITLKLVRDADNTFDAGEEWAISRRNLLEERIVAKCKPFPYKEDNL